MYNFISKLKTCVQTHVPSGPLNSHGLNKDAIFVIFQSLQVNWRTVLFAHQERDQPMVVH